MIPVKRLGHATFETPDIDQQIDHYTKVVGLNVAAREKDRAILATYLGEEVLVLERGPRERTTALSFRIDAAFDIAQGIKALQQRGIGTETRSDITGGIKSATTFNSEWHGCADQNRPRRFRGAGRAGDG